MTKGGATAMSAIRADSQAALATWPSTASRLPASSARSARAHLLGGRRQAAWAVMASAWTVLLAAGCGSGSPGSGASPSRLYQQSLTYSRCMRSHGVPDFPILKRGPEGSLVHPVSPPAGMLTAPGYDAAFRACLKLAVVGGGAKARYQAVALHGLKQAECMRANGITNYPSPATLDGGIHEPDFTAIGLDPHRLQFQAAAKTCGMGAAWQAMWWWPASAAQPGQGMVVPRKPARSAS
jgi:hypothetical protein